MLSKFREFLSKNKKIVIPCVISFVLGLILAFLLMPQQKEIEYKENVKVEYVEKVEYKDRVVEKIVYDRSASKNQKVKVVTKYIERPDGTKETIKEEVAETTEHEVVKVEQAKEKETEIKKEVELKKEIQIEYSEKPAQKNWHVSGSVGLEVLSLTPLYGVGVERRIIGPFFVGARVDSNPSASLVVGFEF
jgi:hypothetical protein